MSDLAEFLLARIAEDEADAHLAMQGFSTGEWTHDGTIYAGHETDEVVDWVHNEAWAHIARHDPASVLAECAAKRLIVEYAEQHPMPCRGSDFDAGQAITLAVTLRYLAAPYSSHPGFRSEWTV